jgi:hypothetical protein
MPKDLDKETDYYRDLNFIKSQIAKSLCQLF